MFFIDHGVYTLYIHWYIDGL